MSFQLHRDGQYLPCDLPALREMARKGELAQDEYVYDERVRQWVGAAQIAEMKDAWSIGENEATVAMELTPEMLAMFDGGAVPQASSPVAAQPVIPPAPKPAPAPQRVSEPAPRRPAARPAESAPRAMHQESSQREVAREEAPRGGRGRAMSDGRDLRFAFEGTGGELFGKLIGGYLLTMITFGIYAPWFMCKVSNFLCEKTTVDSDSGRIKLAFRGQGGDLFVVYLVNMLLTGITFGIYAPWAMCKITGFFADNLTATTGSGRSYALRFGGTGGALFGTYLINMLLTGITLGIYLPWAICNLRKWFYSNTAIVADGSPVGSLDFLGTGGALFGSFLVGQILTFITFGIYFSWFDCNLRRYWNENTRISIHGQTYAMGFNGQGMDLFKIRIVTALLMPFTLGIYLFWGLAKELQFSASNTALMPARD